MIPCRIPKQRWKVEDESCYFATDEGGRKWKQAEGGWLVWRERLNDEEIQNTLPLLHPGETRVEAKTKP